MPSANEKELKKGKANCQPDTSLSCIHRRNKSFLVVEMAM
jgi:hypothetical protein